MMMVVLISLSKRVGKRFKTGRKEVIMLAYIKR